MPLEYNVRLGDPEAPAHPAVGYARTFARCRLVASREGKLASVDVHWSLIISSTTIGGGGGGGGSYPANTGGIGKIITGLLAPVEALGGVKIFRRHATR